ncbi:MAG: 23S rRNA (adenine(2503)-C(2))-methyltransferase RlmN [Desulfovibrio sp.]|jgi:23S rRNA (adenine2503-C2)-methyltransferase|nr:23S rRNA (adenine(2503)-C(2))-methyltransferase RlmN [Desulfovibrio sp.]
MIDILNMTLEELTDYFRLELDQPPFRARQVWKWLWNKRARSFADMSDLSLSLRATLEERAAIIRPVVQSTLRSSDGTVKFLLRLSDGELVESVLIPSESRQGKERVTQCLSSQVGCALGCTFCATGAMGFTRNMTMGEILGQVLVARDYLEDDPDCPQLRNLVFMGMGEPLLNLTEVMKSLKTLNSEPGLSFSPRRITVSTCGIDQGLRRLGESGLAYLAVSLHAPNQELRARLMPKAARWPLESLMQSLRAYPLKARERLTFEYLLLGGINDSPEHAGELAGLMTRVKGKLNLIVYNPAEGTPYAPPTPEAVQAFEKRLRSKHITAIVRKSKGADIDAACGQLRASAVQVNTAVDERLFQRRAS